MKLGFIGLGAMGKRMAMNLLSDLGQLCVYDVAVDMLDEFEKNGAQVCESPKELAKQCDIIMSSLPNSKIVSDVYLGQDGVLNGAKSGSICIDFSSITPMTIKKIYEIASTKGVSVMDAPVSGGTAGAQKGTLTIMVGGDKEFFEKASKIFDVVGSNIMYVGKVGSGDTVKLVNNLLLGTNMAAVSEAFALGAKAGIDIDVLYDVVSQSSGNSYALKAKYENFISKRNFKPGFMIDLQYKDLQLAVDTAKENGVPLLMGNQAQQMFEVARSEGFGKEDISALMKVYEKWIGMKLKG